MGHGRYAGAAAGAGFRLPAAAAEAARYQYPGGGCRRYAAACVRRCRGRVALSGVDRQRLAVVPAGAADLRRPLVLAASGHQPAGDPACQWPAAARRPHRVRRFDPDHAGRTHPRPAHAHAVGQAQADAARGAAGSAPEQAADPGPVPGARALRRHYRGRGSGQLGLPGQAGGAVVARRGCVAGGAAAGAEPAAPGPPPGSGAEGARQGAVTHGRTGCMDAGRGGGRAHRERGGTLAAAAAARRAAGPAPAFGASGPGTHPEQHRHRPAAHAGRTRGQLFLDAAGTHVCSAVGGRQPDPAGARLCRHPGVRRSPAAGPRGHGAGLALAGLHAQTIPVRDGAG
ncbi:hypothetical protein G6F57_014824 [Rhizopus arrhizus]|nr:hypothetical protein G6F57_014824 [Rhizopus arrhizus]